MGRYGEVWGEIGRWGDGEVWGDVGRHGARLLPAVLRGAEAARVLGGYAALEAVAVHAQLRAARSGAEHLRWE